MLPAAWTQSRFPYFSHRSAWRTDILMVRNADSTKTKHLSKYSSYWVAQGDTRPMRSTSWLAWTRFLWCVIDDGDGYSQRQHEVAVVLPAYENRQHDECACPAHYFTAYICVLWIIPVEHTTWYVCGTWLLVHYRFTSSKKKGRGGWTNICYWDEICCGKALYEYEYLMLVDDPVVWNTDVLL